MMNFNEVQFKKYNEKPRKMKLYFQMKGSEKKVDHGTNLSIEYAVYVVQDAIAQSSRVFRILYSSSNAQHICYKHRNLRNTQERNYVYY